MSIFWKVGLLAGVSISLIAGASYADDADATTDDTRELGTIIVTGSAQTYSSSETTEAMTLQQSPVTSILAQVDNLPGVLVQEGDTFGFDDWSTGIAVRGFQNNLGEQQLGITIDGIPNGGSNYGGGAKANRFIDTQNAGSIEVSQGTADIASRSNDALGGTLNFTTQDALDERRIRVSTSLGDFESQRFYGRYDSGLLGDNVTKFWISLSTQSATDHVNGASENERDHIAAKLQTEQFGIDWTAYASYDDTQEDNYQRLFSPADFAANPNSDQLTAEWTGIPYVDQLYRRGWSTLRENSLIYLKGEKEVAEGLNIEAGVYRHDNDGRGDWVPPYLVGAGDNTGQFSVVNSVVDGRFYFTDPSGNALSPATNPGDRCYVDGGVDSNGDGINDNVYVSDIRFPYGGAGPEYSAFCYPGDAIPVQSYRHTHYQKERTGLFADFEWEAAFSGIENTVRGGLWYEDATRYEYRDWHKINDTRVGFEFDAQPYWVQYDREFPQTTFKWYIEDVVEISDFAFRLGLKQFTNEVERSDNFEPANPDLNFTVDSESDVLVSGGAAWVPSAMPGVELFAGYAENYKAIPDTVLEVIGGSGIDGLPDPETAENVEVGVRYVGDRIRGSVVYFDSTFENRLFPAPTESVDGIDYLEASNGGFINGGGIESSGLEVAGELLATDSLSFFASYTYNDATILGTGDASLDTAAGIFAGNQVPGIAENMFVVSADYSAGNFFGGISTKWVDERFVNLSNTWAADSYYDADLYVGVFGEAISDDLSNLEFRLTVNNLLDDDWISGISGNGAWISSPRTVVFTATADF